MDKLIWLWPLSLGGEEKLDEACIRMERDGYMHGRMVVSVARCASTDFFGNTDFSPLPRGGMKNNNSKADALRAFHIVLGPMCADDFPSPVRSCSTVKTHDMHLYGLTGGPVYTLYYVPPFDNYVRRNLFVWNVLFWVLLGVAKDALQLLDLARVLHHVVEGPLGPEELLG